jgi:hypothetical protein
MSTGLENPIRLYRPIRFSSVLLVYVGFLNPLPCVFCRLVQAYAHPSGDNCGDRCPTQF